MANHSTNQLIVIGGGAAGFFCAVNAARLHPHLKVILLEKSNKLLSKVKVSGGGRCNVTHACFDAVAMSKQYPRGSNFIKKAFHQFAAADTVQWFESRGVKLKAEEDGRMFPVTDSSQTIIDCLLREADKYGIEIRMNAEVKKIERETERERRFILHTSADEKLHADFICVACGGYASAPKFKWLTELGHAIEEPVPSLFTFNMPGHPITKLMGISVEKARVKIKGTKLGQEGPLLITHWGLSGPAVLRLSAWGARELKDKNWDFEITVNWLPEYTEQGLRDRFQQLRFEIASNQLGHKNPLGLPQRLWEHLTETSGIKPSVRWADLPAKEQNKLIQQLYMSEFAIKGKTTFKEEFVTAGGIKLNEIDPSTMMSKKVPNLFFAGEIMDVDGITGGFNFQHAWTSGFIAAQLLVNNH